MTSFDYTIKDPMGLHARPAGVMVKQIKPLQAAIKFRCGDREADAKKLFAIMGMAVKCGETVTVSVDGDDEETIAADLKRFFEDNY